MTERLPIPGSDDGTWGDILNGFLEVSLNSDGTLIPQSVIATGAYFKPAGGILSTDLDSTTQTNLTAASTAVQSVNGQTGTAVNLVASDVGALTEAIADGRYVQESTVGQASGVAGLDSNGHVPTAQLPASTTSMVLPTTGAPGAGSGYSGDAALDPATGLVYTNAGGSWSGGSYSASGLPVAIKSGAYTIMLSDGQILANATAAFTLTLPNATTCQGFVCGVRKIDTSTPNTANVIIATQASQTISGSSASLVLYTFGDYSYLISDGSNWRILDMWAAPLIFTASTSFSISAGWTMASMTVIGGGAGGGGGGAAALTSGVTTQVGGGGGGPGGVSNIITAITSGTTLTITVGGGGAAGSGAVASTGATGNAGNGGTNGSPSSVTGTGVSISAAGGSKGSAGGANSTTIASCGTQGGATIFASNTGIGALGSGGPATPSVGGGVAPGLGGLVGGPGGCPASATLGGLGGVGVTSLGASVGTITANGNAATTSGTNAGAPTIAGCGGAGGGGGAPGGAGGNGSAGVAGTITLTRVA